MTNRFNPDFEAFKARRPEEAKSLLASARCYSDPSDDNCNLFLAELGWLDWMDDYTTAEDGEPASESEIAQIVGIVRAAFAEAWGLTAIEDPEEDEEDRATDRPIIRSYSSNVTIQWCGDSLEIGHSGDDLAAYTEFDLYENEDEAHAEWDADVLITIRNKFPRLAEFHNLDEIVHRVAMRGHDTITDAWSSYDE